MKRIKQLEQPTGHDIRDRHPKLLDLEGWFNCGYGYNSEVSKLQLEYKESGSTLKFTRWLSRVKCLDNTLVSEIGKSLVDVSVKLSCRHNDLLRLADTPHYKSCMTSFQGYGRQQLQYLSDPDVAVLFVPDASGKFVWRCLIRLAFNDTGDFVLIHYPIYGNGPALSILRGLAEKTGLFVHRAFHNKNPDLNHIVFTSPTKHNNSFLDKPIWTDGKQKKSIQDRIQVLATKHPVV